MQIKKSLIIVAFSVLLLAPFASAGFFDWLTGNAATNVGVNITLGNSPPHILFVSAPEGAATDSADTVIPFSFQVKDLNGVSDINSATYIANVSHAGESTRAATCSAVDDIDALTKNYSCTVTMKYWDSPAVNWLISVSIKDDGSPAGQGVNDTQVLIYSETPAFTITPDALHWATLTPGETNAQATGTPPMLVNNTGNSDFDQIKINATDLVGESDAQVFMAGNFTADTASGSVCAADPLLSSEFKTISTTLNNGQTSTNNLYYCIPAVPTIGNQAYSTTANGAWTVNVAKA